jgi:hypothetical protein
VVMLIVPSAKMLSQTLNIGLTLDHIQDMKTTVLRHREQLLEIVDKTRAEVLDIMEVAKASIEALLMQHNSKWVKNMK